MDVVQVREKLCEARRRVTEEVNAKYRDGTITQWDELAAGKVGRLLDSIIASIDGHAVPISMDWPKHPATWHYHTGLIGPTHAGPREDCRVCTPE